MAKNRNRDKNHTLRGRTSSRVKRLIKRRRDRVKDESETLKDNNNEARFYQKYGPNQE